MKSSFAYGRVSATWLILIAAFALALGLWFGARLFGPPSPPRLENAVLYPAARALPDFHLTRSDGQPLTLADWKGHWTVAFFGYTNCPDVCPTTLTTFKQVWKQLDAATAAKLRFDFISVDPGRDTPETLARYVGYFSKDFVAATGADDELTALTHALGLVYSRGTPENGTYTVDHSASAVIIDPQGRQVGLFRPPFEAAKIAVDLTALTALPSAAPAAQGGG
jgi:protein SCO1/2